MKRLHEDPDVDWLLHEAPYLRDSITDLRGQLADLRKELDEQMDIVAFVTGTLREEVDYLQNKERERNARPL